MTLEEHGEKIQELRSLDDPRTDPHRPYTPEYSHLEDEWPELAPDGAFYRVFWKKERTDGVEPMEGKTQMLRAARSLAQNRSVHPRTVAGVAWVQLAREGEEPETVDVWGHGYWIEPYGWTKEGVPPRRPDA